MPNSRRNAKAKNKRISNLDISNNSNLKPLRNFGQIYGNLIDDFNNTSLYKQVMAFYFFFLILFVFVIIYFKIQSATLILKRQTNVDYYTSIVLNLLDEVKSLKMELDIINNNDYMLLFYSHLFFFKVYSMELASHNLIKLDLIHTTTPEVTIAFEKDSLTNINYLFTDLNKNNTLDFSLRMNLSQNISDPNGSNHNTLDLNYLTPIIYTFSPLFYQNLNQNGINLFNFYFLGYSYNNGCVSNSGVSDVYFKYPLEKSETSPTISNKDIFDNTLDPIGKCYLKGIKNINETLVKDTNWYYNYEQKFLSYDERVTDSRMITLLKLGLNYEQSQYFVNYLSFKLQDPSGKNQVLTFAQKIDRVNSYMPYLSTNQNGEKSYDYFSMINFPDPFGKSENYTYAYIDKNYNRQDSVFYNNYNIDDNSTMILNTPNFIQNIFKYSMLPYDVVNNVNSFITIDSLMLTYSTMGKIWNGDSINYYFVIDSKIFDLIIFFNNFLLYSQYEKRMISDHNIINSNTSNISLTNSFMTKKFHKCLNSNLTDWYNYVYLPPNLNSSYDCLNDFCFFNKCSENDPFYINPSDLRYLPNCYCFPMYCRDTYTYLDDYSIPKDFRNLNNYTFYSTSNDYFNADTGVIKCRLKFHQKQQNIIPYNYKAAISLQDIDIKYNTTMFMLYIIEEVSIEKNVIDTFSASIHLIKTNVFIFYLTLLFILFITFLKCMGVKLRGLIERIDKFKSIIKIILKISENNYDYNNEAVYDTQGSISRINEEDESKEDDENNILKVDKNIKEDFVTKIKNVSVKNNNNSNDLREFTENLSEIFDLDNKNISDNDLSQFEDKNILNRVREELIQLGIGGEISSKHNDHHDRYSDELQQLIFIIVDNLLEFKIDFNINTNMYETSNKINIQFIELIKSKFIETRIVPIEERINNNSFLNDTVGGIEKNVLKEKDDTDSIEQLTKISQEDLNSNLSLNILYEILSTEEAIDFSQIRSNFCFKEQGDESLISFYKCIEGILYDDSNYTNELTDSEKLKTAINYYGDKIHGKWRDLYLKKLQNNEF